MKIEKQIINGEIQYRRPHHQLGQFMRDLTISSLSRAILDIYYPGWQKLSNEELNAITKELKKETE